MLDPTAEEGTTEMKSLAPRIDGLEGKRIGLYTNIKRAAQPVSEVLEERLREEFTDITIQRFHSAARSDEDLATISEWAREETDACIVCIGDCGGCTRAVVRATDAIEHAGVPAVGLVGNGFELSFETNAADQRRSLRHQVIPIRSETTDIDVIREAITDEEMDGIVDSLTRPLTEEERGNGESVNLLG